MGQVKKTVELYNASHDNVQAVSSGGGSVDCIRRMQKGELCDLLILADDAIIANMMMPEWTDGYYIFAGNSMVLVPVKPDKQIDSNNWKEVLLKPDTTFGHFDPQGDPGGYRAVMACMLADSVEEGLAEKLLRHPGRKILTSPKDEKPDFMFSYRSGPMSKGTPFAELPLCMNLSDPALNEHYFTAEVDLDGDGKNIVRGSAISHALTIPFTAKAPAEAMEFAELFLKTDFKAEGFLPKSRKVGCWPPER